MAQKRYRIVATVAGKDIGSPWVESRELVQGELELIQHAQVSGEAIRLPWLAVRSGAEVTVAHVAERWVGGGSIQLR
jgi:hypothetical protein